MARRSIYNSLAGRIERRLGTMEIGTPLPSELALAEEFGVCKPTVRKALAELETNGLIVKKNGVGSIVAASVRVIPRELVFLCRDIAFFHESLESFGAFAADANFLSSIIPFHGDLETRTRILSTAIARRPAGIVLYAGDDRACRAGYRALADSGIPQLYLIRMPEGLNGDLLTFENGDGIAAVVRRFYERGCRKFALYGDESVNPLAAAERVRGFHDGMRSVRLEPRGEWICLDPERQKAFTEQFRDPRRRPDAVVSLNDVCAGNFYRMLLEAGIDPAGLNLSGFDGSPVTAFLPFPLLTVRPPMAELGRAAAQILIRRIENPAFGYTTEKLSSQLIEVTSSWKIPVQKNG